MVPTVRQLMPSTRQMEDLSRRCACQATNSSKGRVKHESCAAQGTRSTDLDTYTDAERFLNVAVVHVPIEAAGGSGCRKARFFAMSVMLQSSPGSLLRS